MSATDSSETSVQRSVLFATAVAGVAVLLYMFAVEPCAESNKKLKAELDGLRDRLQTTERDLKESSKVKSLVSEAETARKPYLDALLTPLLESWAMRAKSKLDPLADDVGVKVLDYAEMPVRALPLPKPLPKQLYARRPIRVTCQGSYAEIISFVLRVEKMLPYVSLQSIEIKAQNTPEAQIAQLVFEWPVKGASTAAPVAGGVKK